MLEKLKATTRSVDKLMDIDFWWILNDSYIYSEDINTLKSNISKYKDAFTNNVCIRPPPEKAYEATHSISLVLLNPSHSNFLWNSIKFHPINIHRVPSNYQSIHMVYINDCPTPHGSHCPVTNMKKNNGKTVW